MKLSFVCRHEVGYDPSYITGHRGAVPYGGWGALLSVKAPRTNSTGVDDG
ncbi:MAG: hypothetical protein IJY08_06620 [Clostridia bacterium]|nr:hypothetical protein [Clostridia bacterium]